MPLSALSDLDAATWFVEAEADWWTKVCLGPPGFAAYARLQLVPLDGDADDALQRATVAALRDILPDHTTAADRCYFAQWTGCGWDPPVRPVAETVSLMAELAPGLVHSVRDYHLFGGDLSQARWWDGGDPPHLTWPADHAWFVAKDVDPEWIGVGGSSELISGLLARPGIDAAPSAYDASDWETR